MKLLQPSIRAASRSSSEMACSPASSTSMKSGSHCQATIVETMIRGCCAIGLKPSKPMSPAIQGDDAEVGAEKLILPDQTQRQAL